MHIHRIYIPRLVLAVFCTGSLLSFSALAAPPTVNFGLTAQPTASQGAGDTVSLQYSVSGSDLQNVVITFDLAPGMLPLGAAAAGDFATSCTAQDADLLDWTCSFTASNLQVPGGGLSGQIAVTVKYAPWQFDNNEVVTHSATLSADYLDGGNPGSIGPLAANANVTVSGPLTLQQVIQWEPEVFDFAYRRDPGGNMGIVTELYVSISNTSNTPILPGALIDISLPAFARFLEFDLPNPTPVTTLATPALWQTGTVQVQLDNGFSVIKGLKCGGFACSQVTPHNQVFLASVSVWIPCADISTPPAATATVTLTGDAPGHSSGTAALLTVPAPLDGEPMLACGLAPVAVIQQAGSNGVGIGEKISVSGSVYPPTGDSPLYDAFAVMSVPSDVLNPSGRLDFGNTLGNVDYPNGFTLYACIAAAAPATFTLADFLAVWLPSCSPHATSLALPAGTTHLVAHAPVWEGVDAAGAFTAGPIRLTVTGFEGDCSATPPTIDYALAFEARRTPAGAAETAAATLSAPVNDVTYMLLYPGQLVGTVGQTAQFDLVATKQGAPMKNPVFTLDVPAGVQVVNIEEWNAVGSTCTPPPNWTWTGSPMGPSTITIDTKGAGPDVFVASDCASSSCPLAFTVFRVTVLFQSAAPFVNGELVTFPIAVNCDNANPLTPFYPGPAVNTRTATMQVPAEKRARIEPTCDAGQTEGFLVHFENSGGVPLTDATLTVPIPKQSDGSGTQTDAQLVAASSPLGTVECFDGATWSATCNAASEQVRVLAGTLAPYQSGALELTLSFPANPPTGTVVRATGILSSNELLALPLQPSPPLLTGTCPGTLHIDGWYDADQSATRQAGEQGALNWQVTLTETVSAIAYVVVLPSSGVVDLQLSPGTYTTAVAAPNTGATWSFTTTIPSSVGITTGVTTNLDIGIGCGCDDGDACTTDSCTPAGVCTFTMPPEGCCGNGLLNPGEGCDDGNQVSFDGCSRFCQCTSPGATPGPPGQCIPTCGDGLLVGNEACDDANTVAGDGCAPDCTVEPNWTCAQPAPSGCMPSTYCDGSPLPSWCDPGQSQFQWCAVNAPASCAYTAGLDCSTVPALVTGCDPQDLACPGQVHTCEYCSVMGPTVCTLATPIEICDGVDNDGDSLTDETDFGLGGNPDLIGDPCAPAGGGCGQLACDGAGGWTCQQTSTPGDSTCDGVDDDCDGSTDEDVAPISIDLCPGVTTLAECTGALTTVPLPNMAASSGCPPVTYSNDGPNGFALGLTNMSLFAEDSTQAQVSCPLAVTVQDTTPPVIQCPPDAAATADPVLCGVMLTPAAIASDACTGITVSSDAPAVFGPGVTPVNFVATDDEGNQATCQSLVSVSLPPASISCGPPLVVDAAPDACDAQVQVQGTYNPSCGAPTPLQVSTHLCVVGTTDVTLTAGTAPNAVTCTTQVTVNDITAPTIACPPGPDLGAVPAFTADVQDACGTVIAISAVECTDQGVGASIHAPCTWSANNATLTVNAIEAPANHVAWTVTATDPSGNTTVVDCDTALNGLTPPPTPPTPPAPPEDCQNGTDDDLDQLTDCADPDCTLTTACGSADPDNDGATTAQELTCGTDPLLDGDTPSATDLGDPDKDTLLNCVDDDDDGDGLSDAFESTLGTDPLSTDTDGDSSTDAEELSCNTDPVDAASVPLDLNSNGVCDENEPHPTVTPAPTTPSSGCTTTPAPGSGAPVMLWLLALGALLALRFRGALRRQGATLQD